MHGIGSPAVTIGDTWLLLSPLLTHSPRQLFLPRCWRQLWAVEGAPALCCGPGSGAVLLVILGESLPLSEYLLSPL